jgi:hypothetical protein
MVVLLIKRRKLRNKAIKKTTPSWKRRGINQNQLLMRKIIMLNIIEQ